MADDLLYGTSSQEWAGWAPQAAVGEPATPTGRLPTRPGQADATYKIGLVPVDIAGQPVQVADHVPGMGSGTWQATIRLHPTAGRGFVSYCGLSDAGVAVPGRFTLYIHSKTKSILYPGCFCTRTKITSARNSTGGITVALSGILTEKPVPVDPIAPILLTADTPFTHNDMLPVALIGGYTTEHDCKSFEVQVDTPFVTDGGEGVDIPNIVAYDGCSVSGTVAVFFTAAQASEFNAALAKAPAPLAATWTNAAGSARLAVERAKYTDAALTRPGKAIDLLTLPWGAESPTFDAATYATLT